MDCSKVGKLIFALRKELGYTQRELAEKLNISNKTVSKWECGLGCPDVTLWDDLSRVLGADVLILLKGELELNRKDIGKINASRFYYCPQCGNILFSTGAARISCCGRKVQPLVAKVLLDEHALEVEEMDGEYCVMTKHPMTKEHYISFIAYVHLDKVLLYKLYPEQTPIVRMPRLGKGGELYCYCTKHGFVKHPDKL